MTTARTQTVAKMLKVRNGRNSWTRSDVELKRVTLVGSRSAPADKRDSKIGDLA